ncbi:MAG: (Fe-S)-binding protein [bacterium]
MDQYGKQAYDEYRQILRAGIAAQFESCVRCGICAGSCSFYTETGEPRYTPIWKAELLRRAYEQDATLLGKLRSLLGWGYKWDYETLKKWSVLDYEACTSCNRCAQACPMGISIGALIHKAREGLAAAGVVPEDLQKVTRKAVEEGSPLGVTQEVFEERMEWIAEEWEVEIPTDLSGADDLVVFTSIEIQKFPTGIAAIAKILNTAGLHWTISREGREITNFGAFVGDAAITKQIALRIVEAAQKLKVKRVIISECGHANDVMRWNLPNLLGHRPPFEVVHITEVMADLLTSGRIRLKEDAYKGGLITYHDPCKIVRRGGMVEEPRILMKAVAGEQFREMKENREKNWCCGGGGGVISIGEAEPLRMKAFGVKVRQIEEIGAQVVATSCSNCRLQFVDGVKHYNLPVKVTTVSELVAAALLPGVGGN